MYYVPFKICTLLTLTAAVSCAAETPAPPASRAFHFAGGRVKGQAKLGDTYSAAFFLWNALPADARAVTGYAFSRGKDGDKDHGEHLGIGGTHKAEAQGRLILFNGNAADQLLIGKSKLVLKAWHHVVLVREGAKVRVYLDGNPRPDLEGELPVKIESDDVFIGGRADNFASWEGKLDEFALFDRALSVEDIAGLYKASGLQPPAVAQAVPEFPPLSPEDALKSIHVPEGFKVELVACEPNVIDPIAIDWDLAGRLWVVEMADYPSGMDNNGKPGGRVRVLEDTDGDGRYEKSTLFADGLNFPTGLLTWRDGVIVTAAPDILFLKDTNGDGKADSTEKLISGLSEGNQQLRANGLRWGLDNRVYCAAGGHHGGHAAETVLRSHKDGKDEKIGSRDFSFDPDTGDVRAESGPSQFGRNRDDAGNWFGTQNSRALWHYVIPDHYLKRNPYVPAPDPTHQIIPPNAPVYPVSPPEKRFHSFEHASHFTSACSGMIYRDELLWPRRENELDAFTCEPFHNLVQHNILVEDGVTYKAKRSPGEEKHDFFASSDRWCRPVMTRTGPDGALWVVDMYRYMIEHPAWLPDEGKAETLPFYRLGDDKGRIYRVFRADNPPRKVVPMDQFKPVELVHALDSPNEWQRDRAHMALVWHEARRRRSAQTSESIRQELALGEEIAQPATNRSPVGLTHLCSLMGYSSRHREPAILQAALKHVDARVRECSIRTIAAFSREPGFDVSLLEEAGRAASDQFVRRHHQLALQYALSAGDYTTGKPQEMAGQGLLALAVEHFTDPWMHAAVMSSAIPHLRTLCEGIAEAGGQPDRSGVLTSYAGGLITTALGVGDRDSLAALLKPLLAERALDMRWIQYDSVALVLRILEQQKRGLSFLTEKQDALAALAPQFEALLDTAAKDASSEEQIHIYPWMTSDVRPAAMMLLMRVPARRASMIPVLKRWLASQEPWQESLQINAAHALVAGQVEEAPALILPLTLSPQTGVRKESVTLLLSREPWSLMFLDYFKANPAIELDPVQRARLMHHPSAKVRERAAAVLKAESSRKEVLERFRPALALTGDAARGKTVAMRCTGCHQVDGAGIQMGPDFKSVAGHPPEKLLTNIIDPSLDVQPGYYAFNAKLKDGSELYGLITAETGNSVSFKLADGSIRLISRSDIAELKSTGQSLMPAGLEAGMTMQEMADLIAWLRGGSVAAPR